MIKPYAVFQTVSIVPLLTLIHWNPLLCQWRNHPVSSSHTGFSTSLLPVLNFQSNSVERTDNWQCWTSYRDCGKRPSTWPANEKMNYGYTYLAHLCAICNMELCFKIRSTTSILHFVCVISVGALFNRCGSNIYNPKNPKSLYIIKHVH